MSVQISAGAGAMPALTRPLDPAALTKAIAGGVAQSTEVALDLTKVILADAGGSEGAMPTAEDIAAVQQALGLSAAACGRSGASGAR